MKRSFIVTVECRKEFASHFKNRSGTHSKIVADTLMDMLLEGFSSESVSDNVIEDIISVVPVKKKK